jgi:hypothetical protein
MPADHANTRRPRRWFRFSLRTLFVLVTVAAVWLGLTMKRIRDQERAVARILELGGDVGYDYQWDYKYRPRFETWSINSNSQPPGPQWLRRLFGPQWNVDVLTVGIYRSTAVPATDRDLELLRNLPHVRAMDMNGSEVITDAGLRHVGRLTNLTDLRILECAGITDEGLAHLSGLKRLNHLLLQKCNMDGSGLRYLAHLPIEKLQLEFTPVTDAALEHVARFTRLTELSLQYTNVTNEGVARLKAALPNCRIQSDYP